MVMHRAELELRLSKARGHAPGQARGTTGHGQRRKWAWLVIGEQQGDQGEKGQARGTMGHTPQPKSVSLSLLTRTFKPMG